MGLVEYRRKRHFNKTPEPRGNVKPKSPKSALRCVIQKHAAGRLHYDFRLELEGVLKSWAVPKGPSLDPSVKALAVHVEDHPIEYGTFEGTIPQGEYGGGTVMLWDRGKWEPEADARKDYERGKLTFQLYGEKLQGRWTLIRMGGSAGDGGKNWLLKKLPDQYARPTTKYSVVEKLSNSVASGRTMDEIAGASDRVWTSKGEMKGKKTK